MSVLPPVRLAPPSQEDIDVLQELGDAFHNPEVLDVRRQVSMLGMVRGFVLRELTMLNALSPIHPPLTTRWNECSGTLNPAGSDLVEVDVCIEQFQVLRLLGSGAYGRVYKVIDRTSGKALALKVIKKSQLESRHVKTILSEQDALARMLGNLHSLQLAASFHDSANFYMVVTLKTGGDLQKQIEEWDGIPLDITKFYAAELLVGIFSLHRRGVLHRDIKPGNILLDDSGHVVISDFGLAKVFELGSNADNFALESPYYFNGATNQLSQAPYLTSGCCGTLSHMAPEIFFEQSYGFAVDYWALAVTIYEMLTGGTPWYSNVQTEFMLKKEPMERLSYEAMRSHPFFEGIDWEKIECHSLAPPYVPEGDAESEDCMDQVDDDIKRGVHYTPEDDPLPQFAWSSPAFIK
ncbi:kinase-like protein, partial [Paxillus ammoniavirescens]